MSIINDALKKLQHQIGPTNPAPSQNTPTSQPEQTPAQLAGFQPVPENAQQQAPTSSQPKEEKPKKESRLVLILGILCLLISLFAPIVNKQSLIVVLINQIPKKQIAVPKKEVLTPAAMLSPAPTPIPQPEPQAEPEQKQQPISTLIKNLTTPAAKVRPKTQNRIIINGVMSNGGQNLVLIDGQVYEEGEEVNGVKLIKITPKGVTVLEDGQERTIKVLGQ